MNPITSVFFYSVLIIIALLAFCVIYLVLAYRRILKKYAELELAIQRKEADLEIKQKTDSLIDKNLEKTVEDAARQAATLISKSANDVSANLAGVTTKKLLEEEAKKAKEEINRFKFAEFEKIKLNAKEILEKAMPDILANSIPKQTQEKIILEELENARQNIL